MQSKRSRPSLDPAAVAQGIGKVVKGRGYPRVVVGGKTLAHVKPTVLTVRAALDGSRNHVYQAALLDPNTSAALTTAQTVAMCDELFDAHQRLLPPALRR